MRLLRRSPVQTFVLVPLATVAFELAMGTLRLEPIFLLVMAWGFAQYRLCGRYRVRLGGGGPGFDKPPERLVTTGLYAWTHNPMYLGHIIFMAGVALTFQSWFGAAIALARAAWFHVRVLRDEKRLAVQFGEPYLSYVKSVKRWMPGAF